MTMRAVILDLGGVLLELDWEKRREDERRAAFLALERRTFFAG